MSLDKGIKYGKEHRKEYYDCRAIDRTCRSHGSCPWCERNRKYKNLKREQEVMAQLKDKEEF